jgi:hypothetical protein
MLAIEKGNTWFLPILLKHGADPFVTDRKGKNAFDYAADNVGALEILHKHQAFGATSAGTAPAAAAAATAPVSTAAAHSPKTALLPPALKASTHFDLFATRDMWEALYEKNLEKLHKALATERADTNLEDDTHGISPLEYSALNCKDPAFSLSAFTILLRKGADPVRPRNGSTPFHNIACAYSLYSDHMQILATHKDIHTIINVRKGNGKTPLICAIEARKPLSIIDPLLACGAEPLIADNDGCDARHYAQSNEALLKTINEHIARGKKAKSHAAALGTAPAKAGSGRGPAASYGAAAAAAGLAAASPAICTASAAAAGPLTPLRTPTPAMKESNRESLLVTATRALPALGLAAAAAAGLHTLAGSPPTPQLMLGAGPHMAAAAKPG